MVCPKCEMTPAPECKEVCTNPATCPCQHRETEVLEDGTIAPKGVRKDVR